MSKFLFFSISFSLLFFALLSCQKEIKEMKTLPAKIQSIDEVTIKKSINYKNTFEKFVSSISKVENYNLDTSLVTIVTYTNFLKEEKKVAIESVVQRDGMVIPRFRLECEGGCNQPGQCQLAGPITQYLECTSCSEGCAMVYTSLNREMLEDKFEINIKGDSSIEELAAHSYQITFKKNPENIKVTSVEIEEDNVAKAMSVMYQDDKGNKSSFMIVEYKESVSSRDPKKKIKIDCTGSCDCRERYIFGTGGIECTCSPCDMTVTEL